MKLMKIIGLTILSIIGIILCLVLVINLLGYRSNIANGITGTEIKQIEMGMPLEEVISILGKPFEIYNLHGQHDLISCKKPKFLEMSVNENTDIIHVVDSFFNDTSCCDSYKESIQRRGKQVTLTYTKPVCLSIYYPMLWVHLDSNYCVWNVYAKRKDHIDDITIYSLSWKMDTITWEDITGERSLLINDELFEKCFKSKKQ